MSIDLSGEYRVTEHDATVVPISDRYAMVTRHFTLTPVRHCPSCTTQLDGGPVSFWCPSCQHGVPAGSLSREAPS